ncbi:hypothetical protein BH23PAT2_BH23PAT2_10570 [soil metagenome]
MNFESLGWLVALGTLAFSVYRHFDKKNNQKVKVRVTLQNGKLTFHGGDLSEAMLFIKAANVGSKAVTINTPSINVKHSDGGSLFTEFGSYQRLPYVLEPGDSVVAWHEIKPIVKALKGHGLSGKVKLEGFFTSQVGDEYKAKLNSIDVDDWSKD